MRRLAPSERADVERSERVVGVPRVVRHGVPPKSMPRVVEDVPSCDFFALATSCATTGRLNDLYTFPFDAQGAFLHMPDVEQVLREPPLERAEVEGLVGNKKVWKMERTLYGSRPVAKAWAEWIADDLVAHRGMVRHWRSAWMTATCAALVTSASASAIS